MSLSVDYMKIVLFIDAIDFHYRQTDICNAMQLAISLEHLVEQTTPVLLGRHRVLRGVRNRIYKVAIIADDGIIVFRKKLCNGALYCCKYLLSCSIVPRQSSKFNTNNSHIVQRINGFR